MKPVKFNEYITEESEVKMQSKLTRENFLKYYQWDDTASKWEKYFDEVTKKVSKLIIEICELDLNDKYYTKK